MFYFSILFSSCLELDEKMQINLTSVNVLVISVNNANGAGLHSYLVRFVKCLFTYFPIIRLKHGEILQASRTSSPRHGSGFFVCFIL